jgi:hypothetical protein
MVNSIVPNNFHNNHFYTFCALLAIFLVGINFGMIITLRNRVTLVRWFKLKIFAVTGLLLYIALSIAYGNPSMWRVMIGLVAMIIDLIAVLYMWHQIATSSTKNGPIPIAQLHDDNGGD